MTVDCHSVAKVLFNTLVSIKLLTDHC